METEEQLLESLEAMPRNYALACKSGSSKFYFSPATHIVGNALRTGPEVLERRMRATQAYHRRGHSYEQLFPWPDSLLADGNPYAAVRKRVKRKEGTYTLLDLQPHEAVADLLLEGNVLTASVSSKSGRGRYNASLKSAYLNHEGDFDIADMQCGCEDHFWDRSKGGNTQTIVECLHIAAMEQELYERMNFGDRNKVPMGMKTDRKRPPTGLFSPFTFTQNWYREDGRMKPISRHRAALEMDVLVAHYVTGKTFYGINQSMLNLPNLYSSQLAESIMKGETTYEIIKQRRKSRRSPKAEADAEKYLFRQLHRHLMAHGYHYDGFYLEMGRPAMRFEGEQAYAGLVFSSEYPPFYVLRMKGGRGPHHLAKDEGETNPFAQLNYKQGRIDDKTRKVTATTVRLPNRLALPETSRHLLVPIPEVLRQRYRQLIQKYSRHPSWDLTKAGLA